MQSIYCASGITVAGREARLLGSAGARERRGLASVRGGRNEFIRRASIERAAHGCTAETLHPS